MLHERLPMTRDALISALRDLRSQGVDLEKLKAQIHPLDVRELAKMRLPSGAEFRGVKIRMDATLVMPRGQFSLFDGEWYGRDS
jgi:hypothetical protein